MNKIFYVIFILLTLVVTTLKAEWREGSRRQQMSGDCRFHRTFRDKNLDDTTPDHACTKDSVDVKFRHKLVEKIKEIYQNENGENVEVLHYEIRKGRDNPASDHICTRDSVQGNFRNKIVEVVKELYLNDGEENVEVFHQEFRKPNLGKRHKTDREHWFFEKKLDRLDLTSSQTENIAKIKDQYRKDQEKYKSQIRALESEKTQYLKAENYKKAQTVSQKINKLQGQMSDNQIKFLEKLHKELTPTQREKMHKRGLKN
ncbi:MAG: UvrB/UvrC motif-containing protein [Candidatus Cloacimonetes bacterium]|nr:UvrB/UvrC motif-containing protein [Candidatus Cloacimonadota bacterium]